MEVALRFVAFLSSMRPFSEWFACVVP